MCVFIHAQVYIQAETTGGCWEFSSSVLHLVFETGSLTKPCPLSLFWLGYLASSSLGISLSASLCWCDSQAWPCLSPQPPSMMSAGDSNSGPLAFMVCAVAHWSICPSLCFCFWNRILLCHPSWPGAHCTGQAGLRNRGSPASALGVNTTRPCSQRLVHLFCTVAHE